MKTLTQKTEPSNTEPISLAESKRLIELEKVIEVGQKAFIEVGTALAEIRDARLYKADYKTFENYCVSKWGFKRAHAYRLIAAAGIAKDLSPIGNIPESVVREIAKVEPSKRQEVYDKATETASGHVPTAREIKQVVEMEEEEIKETSPVKNQPMQINILNKGMTHYAAAKAELDKIHKDDLHREQALKEIIRYAKNRLEANK